MVLYEIPASAIRALALVLDLGALSIHLHSVAGQLLLGCLGQAKDVRLRACTGLGRVICYQALTHRTAGALRTFSLAPARRSLLILDECVSRCPAYSLVTQLVAIPMSLC